MPDASHGHYMTAIANTKLRVIFVSKFLILATKLQHISKMTHKINVHTTEIAVTVRPQDTTF